MKRGMTLRKSGTLIELAKQQMALAQKRKNALAVGDEDGVKKYEYHLKQTESGFDRVTGGRMTLL